MGYTNFCALKITEAERRSCVEPIADHSLLIQPAARIAEIV